MFRDLADILVGWAVDAAGTPPRIRAALVHCFSQMGALWYTHWDVTHVLLERLLDDALGAYDRCHSQDQDR